MELKEFVSETLTQILEGITSAQEKELGDNVNASFAVKDTGNIINGGAAGRFTSVNFDVSVLTETKGKGGAKLSVMGVDVGGEGERKAGTTNRIQFSVPVRIPDGDVERIRIAREKHKVELEKLGKERASRTRRRPMQRESWMA